MAKISIATVTNYIESDLANALRGAKLIQDTISLRLRHWEDRGGYQIEMVTSEGRIIAALPTALKSKEDLYLFAQGMIWACCLPNFEKWGKL